MKIISFELYIPEYCGDGDIISGETVDIEFVGDEYESSGTYGTVEYTDSDGDGIEDSIDTEPNKYSNNFHYTEGNVFGEIKDRAGHKISIYIDNDQATISVTSGGGSSDALVQVFDTVLELKPGALIGIDWED